MLIQTNARFWSFKAILFVNIEPKKHTRKQIYGIIALLVYLLKPNYSKKQSFSSSFFIYLK